MRPLRGKLGTRLSAKLGAKLSARLPAEDHYVWRPGAPPARPPRPLWPRILGVSIAIGAQIGLYLMLRRIAIATMPAWAHIHAHHARQAAPYPSIVGVDVVKGASGPVDASPSVPLPSPVLQDVPVVPVAPPDLGR